MKSANDIKTGLRRELRALAARHTKAEVEQGSRAICERILDQNQWRNARQVLFFSPLADEPDLRPLITPALEAGKNLAFPRFDAAAGSYQVCNVTDPGSQLVPGEFGIPEPRFECPVCKLNELDFALVPGIGFSLDGGRLGRGKGYFDRMLSNVRGWKCGVAFDWQIATQIPVEPHDIRLNSIVTPTRWHVVA